MTLMRAFKVVDLHRELFDGDLEMEVYRNKRGDYVSARHGRRRPGLVTFIEQMQIAPERLHGAEVCTIGKSAVDGKWYGWSHRAIVGFGRGDRIFEENYGTCTTPFKQHGRRTIFTDADAKLAATNFARSVS